jgi:hypothetical protein
VIIASPGVAGNRRLTGLGGGAALVVEFSDANNGFRGREKIANVAAKVGSAIGEVSHFAGHALLGPGLVSAEIVRRIGGGDAGKFESAISGGGFDEIRSQLPW